MYEALNSVRVDQELMFRHGSSLESKPKEAPKEKTEKERLEDSRTELFLQWNEHTKEKRAEQIERCVWPKQKPKQPKPKPQKRKYVLSEEAKQRREERYYANLAKQDETLTPAQKQVLTDLSNGLQHRAVAVKNRIAQGTVAAYMYRIRERLGAHSNHHAIKIAVQKGLIE